MDWFAAHCINHCSIIQLNDRPFKSAGGFNVGVFIWTRKEFPLKQPLCCISGRLTQHIVTVLLDDFSCLLSFIQPTAPRPQLIHHCESEALTFRTEVWIETLSSPCPTSLPVSFQIRLFHVALSGFDYRTAHGFAILINPSYFLISSSRRETASSLPHHSWVKQ